MGKRQQVVVMVDCDQPVRLDAYHDGELSAAERAAVEAHLCDCPSCAAELAAIRAMSGVFADAAPREASREQLLRLARGVRPEPYDARLLLGLFRGAAVAAAVVLACALAAGAHLSRRTKAAAHEAMVLDHVAMPSPPAAFAAGDGQRVLLAQWIADDLQGRPEER
jgi:anti-sigma factor RsiW